MQDWKQAETEFVEFFSSFGKDACVIRLSDTAQAKATSGKHAFIQAQPSDFLLTLTGTTHYAEVKSSKHPSSFPFSNIKKMQWATSRKVVGAGGSYLFFIKRFPQRAWYLVPAQVLHAQRPKKSITWKSLEPYIWNKTSPTA